MNRRIKALGVLAVVALAATGCGGGGTGTGSATTLVVGVDIPFQGSAKDASDSTWNAMTLYMEQIGNKVGNYKIELKKYDNSTAAKGAWDDGAVHQERERPRGEHQRGRGHGHVQLGLRQAHSPDPQPGSARC